MKRYIILDRDGVINFESEKYIKNPDEWLPIPGSLKAIADLNRAGYAILIVTNQSGVGRGFYDIAMLNKIHDKLRKELAMEGGSIEEIFFCPHHPDDKCLCRKPQPGLLHQIQKKYQINFKETFFIGDSTFDMEAARAVGCEFMLVLTGNGEKTLQKYPELESKKVFNDLAAAAKYLLSS